MIENNKHSLNKGMNKDPSCFAIVMMLEELPASRRSFVWWVFSIPQTPLLNSSPSFNLGKRRSGLYT